MASDQADGTEGLAARASKKLKGDELLMTVFGPTRLRMELDRVPLWRGNHVAVGQLFEDFAKYAYLPRLKSSRVLVDAMQSGVALLTWTQDSFAYADSYDSAADRYRGLVYGRMVSVPTDGRDGVLVHPHAAMKQMQAETVVAEAAASPSNVTTHGLELVSLKLCGAVGLARIRRGCRRGFTGVSIWTRRELAATPAGLRMRCFRICRGWWDPR